MHIPVTVVQACETCKQLINRSRNRARTGPCMVVSHFLEWMLANGRDRVEPSVQGSGLIRARAEEVGYVDLE